MLPLYRTLNLRSSGKNGFLNGLCLDTESFVVSWQLYNQDNTFQSNSQWCRCSLQIMWDFCIETRFLYIKCTCLLVCPWKHSFMDWTLSLRSIQTLSQWLQPFITHPKHWTHETCPLLIIEWWDSQCNGILHLKMMHYVQVRGTETATN